MTTIKITNEFAALVASLVAAGKTPYLIINADYAVGAYGTRNEARTAKAENKFEGKVVKASDVQVEVVDLKAKASKNTGTNVGNYDRCPKCGSTELYAGRNVNGLVQDEDTVIGCHHCDWEVDTGILRKSKIDSPCYVVWDTADKMKGARRKDVIAACVAKGIAYYTARTQYQLWSSAKKA